MRASTRKETIVASNKGHVYPQHRGCEYCNFGDNRDSESYVDEADMNS
jgi:hypothetical protein